MGLGLQFWRDRALNSLPRSHPALSSQDQKVLCEGLTQQAAAESNIRAGIWAQGQVGLVFL